MTFAAHWTWEFDAPRERLWEYLADTDWVNEHAGLPRIVARFEPLPHGGTRKFGSFGRGPFSIEWEEMPTVWRVPESYAIERRYTHGPLKRFRNTLELMAIAQRRTRVDVGIELEAATPLVTPLLPLVAAAGKRGANRAFRRAARLASLAAETQPAAYAPRIFTSLVDAGIAPEVIAALESFVTSAEDRDLLRMRPYELADRWKLPRRDVLRACLYATRAGKLNLRWNVICPGCRGPQPGMETLESLQRGYHCPSCNIPFDAVFDRSVEVTFNARPLGRGGEEGLFCLASPQRSAHVYAQSVLPAGTSEEVLLALRAGVYDVNAVGVAVAPFVASANNTLRRAVAQITDGSVDVPDAVGTGELQLLVENRLDRDAIVRIEDGRWPDTLVTAAEVTAMQEFRDLFSSEVLAPGLELGIESLAILFTDLVGSTALYSRAGDAPAFRIVTNHFDAIRDVVARYEGTIVKTIGDAVMAVFVDPVRCFDAALELDACLTTIESDGMPLRLRVGFHSGPCIAMRANDRIDYFGTNVNLAARLQSVAEAGQVTMASSDAALPAIAARIAAVRATIEKETLDVKGFSNAVDVVRVTA